MADEGDQQKYWTITRYFAELVARQLEGTCKVLYPDMGSAAMLKNAWPDAGFEIGSLSDRNPIQETYSALIIAAPDPQVLEDTKRVTALAGEVPVILFNPRLVSGDVGIGLNVRRMREQFLKTFVITYSLRSLGPGSVFRKYPDMWKVFVEDEDQPGRYRLVHESTNKPQGETLDLILLEAFPPIQGDEEESGVKSMLESAGRTIASMQRFLRNVSR